MIKHRRRISHVGLVALSTAYRTAYLGANTP
jgi:hypothetical protein